MFKKRQFLIGFPAFGVVIGLSSLLSATAQISQQELQGQAFAQASPLIGNWRLTNMTESSAPTPMVPSAELTADFADNRISGSGGCNRFMGSYQTQGEQLTIGELASTFMACEESIMNQEVKYLSALQGAQRYEVNDQNQLTIFYQTEQESGVLRFIAQDVRALW